MPSRCQVVDPRVQVAVQVVLRVGAAAVVVQQIVGSQVALVIVHGDLVGEEVVAVVALEFNPLPYQLNPALEFLQNSQV